MPIDRAKVSKEAEKLLAAGRVDRAIEEFRKVLDDKPDDPILMNKIGDLCLQAGRTPEAVDLFKRLALSYERGGFAQKATAIFKKALRAAPDDVDMSQRLADLYRQTGMLKDAVGVHLQVAEHFTKKGLIKRALEEFTKVVELDPKNLKMKIKLADTYNKEGMKDRAAAIYLEVAEALAIEQMHTEAGQILERAKAMVSTPQVYLTQSRLCVIQKDLAGASSHLREGLATNPRSTELLEALAEVELQAKSPEKALEAMSQIPQMPEKAVNLCERALREMVKSGRVDEGLALFKSIGRELARRGMGEAATKILRTAMQGQFTTESWIQLAEIAHQGGNRPDQISALQNAYSLAQQTNDQTLSDWVLERLREIGAAPGQSAGATPGTRPGTQPIPILAPQEHTLPGTDTTFTDLDPLKRMQIEQLEREAESLVRIRSGDRAVEVYKKILDLDPTYPAAIERIADIHRASGMLTKVQMHYVGMATQLAKLGKRRLASELLDKAEALFPGSTRMHRRQLGLMDVGGPAAAPEPLVPPAAAPIALGTGVPGPAGVGEALDSGPDTEGLIPLDLPGAEAPLTFKGTQPMPISGVPWSPEEALPVVPFEVPAPGQAPGAPPAPELDWGDMGEFPPLESEFGQAAATVALPASPLPPTVPAEFQEIPDFLQAPPPELSPTPVLAAGPAAPVDDELTSLLSDVDFQLDYGSPEEAKIEIENALQSWPEHPELLKRLGVAEEALRKLGHAPAAGPAIGEPEHSFFDLTDVLGEALLDAGEGEEMHDATSVVEKVQSVEELFDAFREGVEQQVKADDYDTHYNLGIAYKEMMLLEPAMEEFKKAMADPERTLECCSMLSICEQSQGNMDQAIDWLQQGITAPGFPPEDSIGLRYDLGEIFLLLGRNNEALEQFQRVYDMDPEYREVASKV
ncbi:MAG: tetratricopeptide repeat protein [Acidobacteria bacterium]|nr:tetratricopeptide repeat protein [Acidobacteriota bacterium]